MKILSSQTGARRQLNFHTGAMSSKMVPPIIPPPGYKEEILLQRTGIILRGLLCHLDLVIICLETEAEVRAKMNGIVPLKFFKVEAKY